jgi:hypothetical protein
LLSVMRPLSFFFLALLSNSALAATWNSPTGKLSDVQNTVNSAASGDTVLLPSGTFVWNGTLSITKSLILKGQGVTSTFINRATPLPGGSIIPAVLEVNPASDVPIRVTGIAWNAESIGQNYDRLPAITVNGPDSGCTQVRIDHCSFTGGVCAVDWEGWAYGVVDHCTFTDCPYAVQSYADNNTAWMRPIQFGTANEVYVEDCTFIMDGQITYFDTLTDEDFGGRMCMRYSTIDFSKFTAAYDFGSVWMTHGNQSYWANSEAEDLRGACTLELYNNTVTTNQAFRILYLRGGQTVCYNNDFNFPNSTPPISSMTEEEGYDGPGTSEDWFNPLRKTWPAEDQVNNTFFWDNTYNGAPQDSGEFSGWETTDSIVIQEGRDYFLSEPGGSTATKYPVPGSPSSTNYSKGAMSSYYAPVTSYTAFRYPHPLTDSGFTGGGGASSSPTPTPTPKPTPKPTPTPTPKPTPTPTPKPTPTPTPKSTPTPTPKPTPTPTPKPTPTPPSYQAWENGLYSEMQRLGISQAHINRLGIWMVFNPPTLSGGSYSAWENELFAKIKSIGANSKLTQLENWVESHPPSS